MMPLMQTLLSRVAGHWKTSLIGAVEGAGITGISQLLNDPAAVKVTLGIAAWRFVVGLLSRDPG